MWNCNIDADCDGNCIGWREKVDGNIEQAARRLVRKALSQFTLNVVLGTDQVCQWGNLL
jgi:hypothetical protein